MGAGHRAAGQLYTWEPDTGQQENCTHGSWTQDSRTVYTWKPDTGQQDSFTHGSQTQDSRTAGQLFMGAGHRTAEQKTTGQDSSTRLQGGTGKYIYREVQVSTSTGRYR